MRDCGYFLVLGLRKYGKLGLSSLLLLVMRFCEGSSCVDKSGLFEANTSVLLASSASFH